MSNPGDYYGMAQTIDEKDRLIAELQAQVDALVMDRATRDARIAVFTVALAGLAKEGYGDYALEIVRKADEAAKRVKPKDLTVAQTSVSKGDGDEHT